MAILEIRFISAQAQAKLVSFTPRGSLQADIWRFTEKYLAYQAVAHKNLSTSYLSVFIRRTLLYVRFVHTILSSL